MSSFFPIIEVPDDAAQAQEAMGSKFKFWFRDPDLGDCLFKRSRPNTGEDWSEKVAAELCAFISLPHAVYELAVWRDFPGTVSPNLLSPGTALVHGNDILAGLVSSYPKHEEYGASQHTLTLVLSAIKRPGIKPPHDWTSPREIHSAVAVFVGYLLLDAWIGNGDRHHENWGFIVNLANGTASLCPTYDHAACLGRELLDEKRRDKLKQNAVEVYAKRSRSAFYRHEGDGKPQLTFDIFATAAQLYGRSAALWLDRLAQVKPSDLKCLLEKIPRHRASSEAKKFAYQMLIINRSRLLCLRESLT